MTADALAPFRKAMPPRPKGDPEPLPYLDDPNRGQAALAVQVEATLTTDKMRAAGLAPHILSRGSADAAMYWSAAQIVAHHSANGCNLQPGDLIGTGTLSTDSGRAGSARCSRSARAERRRWPCRTAKPRSFLEDGDEVTLKAWCEAEGAVRIGFGECVGRVVASA